jgi:hypothetical protein
VCLCKCWGKGGVFVCWGVVLVCVVWVGFGGEPSLLIGRTRRSSSSLRFVCCVCCVRGTSCVVFGWGGRTSSSGQRRQTTDAGARGGEGAKPFCPERRTDKRRISRRLKKKNKTHTHTYSNRTETQRKRTHRREDGDELPPCEELVPVLHHLRGSGMWRGV